MPSSNTDGNYTKVSQVVPVKISLDSAPSKNVVPGMNAEVKFIKTKEVIEWQRPSLLDILF